MKRYGINLLLDTRVKLVLVLVAISVLVAIFLTYLEFRFRRKKEKEKIVSEEEKFIKDFLKKMDSYKSPREKMDFLDATAKKFLNEKFGTKINEDYSTLKEELKKHKDAAFFCDSMFYAYYSSEITDEKADYLSKIFLEIYRSKNEKTRPQKKSVVEKFEPRFSGKENFKKGLDWIKDFIYNKVEKISKLFLKRKKKLETEWGANFRDVEKEEIIKKTEEGKRYKFFENTLAQKQKEIARVKLKKESDKRRYLIYGL